jgi:hypothetical protein
LYSCDNLQGACKAQASYPVYSNSNKSNSNSKTTMPQTSQINLSDADFNAALVTAIRHGTANTVNGDLLHGLPVEDVSPLNGSLLIRVNISHITGFAGYDGT